MKEHRPCKEKTPSDYPLTAYLCTVYSVISVVLLGVALAAGGVSPRWTSPDPQELLHASSAILLIFSAMMAEICFLVSSKFNIRILSSESSNLLQRGCGDAWITLAEYAVKLACGIYISWCSGGIIHTDSLALEGPRPVYFGRFAQWSVGVPLLGLIGCRAFLAPSSNFVILKRFGPNMLAAYLYVWAAWVMEVTESHLVRWPMMMLSFLGFALTSADQIQLVFEHRGEQFYFEKKSLTLYTIITSAGYALVFLMGRFGFLTSVLEQSIYAYSDATVKVLQGALLAMIRHREQAFELRKWWRAAVSANQELGMLIDSACVPILSIDASGNVTQWNNSLSKLSGFSAEQAIGKPFLKLVSKECREQLLKEMARIMEASCTEAHQVKEGARSRSMFEVTFSEGEQVCTLAMVFVPKFKDGVQEGAHAIGYDLSELMSLQMLQERKSAFMGVLSHEIRSPLHGILGLTTALLETPAGKQLKHLGMIKSCTSRLLDLVSNIMELAQAEKKRSEGVVTELPRDPVDIVSIVDEAITMLQASMDKSSKPLLKASVLMVNEVGPQPLFPGSPYKVTQVVYNLLTNACKFTDRGTITVRASYEEDQQLVLVSVTDTGKGISREGQAKIFEPFEQEKPGDARSFQGIGLGLAVCKDIVELHGGTIVVESEPGHGSTFTLSFPCDGKMGWGHTAVQQPVQVQENGLEAEAQPRSTTAQSEASTQTGLLSVCSKGRKPLILSVDDDEVNQEVIKSALGSSYEIHCAMDGFQALKYLEEHCHNPLLFPSLVLLDIQMPGLTGYDVCEEIRKSFASDLASLPVIMISAKAPAEDTAIQGFYSGSTDFIPKPFNKELLKCKVAAAIKINHELGAPAGKTFMASEGTSAIQRLQKKLSQAEAEATNSKSNASAFETKWKEAANRAEKAERELSDVRTRQQPADEDQHYIPVVGQDLKARPELGAPEDSTMLAARARGGYPRPQACGKLSVQNTRLVMQQLLSAQATAGLSVARLDFVRSVCSQLRNVLALHSTTDLSLLCHGNGTDETSRPKMLLDMVDSQLRAILDHVGTTEQNFLSERVLSG